MKYCLSHFAACFVTPSGAKLLGAAACASLGELARVAPLPLPEGIGDKATARESDETMVVVTAFTNPLLVCTYM